MLKRLEQGCTNCSVVPNIFGIIITLFLPHSEMCIVGPQYDTCSVSPSWCLDFGGVGVGVKDFWKTCRPPVVCVCVCVCVCGPR
jgi:hypothetical protein